MSLPLAWGATAGEVARHYPADDVYEAPTMSLNRAVTVHAPAELLYRWLCQITLAPYSYDLLDNWGRCSPTQLLPGADRLEVGQRLMIFTLTDVRPGRQFSGVMLPGPAKLFGRTAISYAAEPDDAPDGPEQVDGSDVARVPARSRLVCRLVLPLAGPIDALRARALAWGDLVMMRRQLMTLKRYAERDARSMT